MIMWITLSECLLYGCKLFEVPSQARKLVLVVI